MRTHLTTISIGWLFIAIHMQSLLAQESNRQSSIKIVGAAFRPEVAQVSNAISAREVRWIDSHGVEQRTYVFFEKTSHHVITAQSTNQVCFYNGKFLSFLACPEAFMIEISKPTEIQDLSETNAATYGCHVFPDRTSIARLIDLESILKSENSLHTARPLVLRKVEPKVENGNVVVYFESFTHLKGKVTLDDQLNSISMETNLDPVSK